MTHAYHGITEAVVALSPEIRDSGVAHVECLAPPSGNCAQSSASDAEIAAKGSGDFEQALSSLRRRGFRPAALIFDSAFTSSGIYDPPPGWITPIIDAVRAEGGLIIGDEVQYGLGRCDSHFWGFSRRGYSPDIVTLGKPIGNGYPLGVVITRRAILERFQQMTRFFSTFGGNPVAAAAGIAVLNIVEQDDLTSKAEATGLLFREELLHLSSAHRAIGEIRGAGLLIGVEVMAPDGTPAPHRARLIVNKMRDQGVLIGTTGPLGHVLKLRPPDGL